MEHLPGQLFYRSDLGLWFRYDGTRWLSQRLTAERNSGVGNGSVGMSATDAAWCIIPAPPSLDLWIESFEYSYYVVSGGTALDASNKWAVNLSSADATTLTGLHSSLQIDSGASTEWRKSTLIAASTNLLAAATYEAIIGGAVKTGTPGNLRVGVRMNYRLVGT